MMTYPAKRSNFRCLFLLLWWMTVTAGNAIAQPAFQPASVISSPDTVAMIKSISAASKLKAEFPDSAVRLLQDIYRQSRSISYDRGSVLALSALSVVQMQLGQYASAQSSLREALQFTNEKRLPQLLPLIYNNLGNAYSYMAQYDSAAYNYFLALRYKEQFHRDDMQQSPPITYIYNNLSFSHFEAGNLEQAYHYLQKIKAAAGDASDTNLLANNYNNLGGYYFMKERWDSCAFAYGKAISWAQSNRNKSILFMGYTGLGNLYDKLLQPDSSLYYYLQAYNLYQDAPVEKNGYNTLLCNIGNLYKQKKDYANAMRFYRQVEKDPAKTPKERAFLLMSLSGFYADQGAFEKAYKLKEQYYALNDSLKSISIAVQISDLESRYELSRKSQALAESDAQLAAQQLQTQTRNLWIWILSITFLSLIIIARVWHGLQRKRQKAENMILGLRSKIAGAEKERNRIAHDLHDSVNSQLAAAKSFLLAAENIYPQLVGLKEFKIAKDILTDTSSEVRNVAHNLAPDILLKDGLITAISVFCDNLFASSGIEHHVHAAGDFEDLAPGAALHIYRIVQELCNNALKHSGAGAVTILLTHNGQKLEIVVEDNGKGLPETTGDSGRGIGLSGITDRVKMLQGVIEITTMPDKYTAFYISFSSKTLCKL